MLVSESGVETSLIGTSYTGAANDREVGMPPFKLARLRTNAFWNAGSLSWVTANTSPFWIPSAVGQVAANSLVGLGAPSGAPASSVETCPFCDSEISTAPDA